MHFPFWDSFTLVSRKGVIDTHVTMLIHATIQPVATARVDGIVAL